MNVFVWNDSFMTGEPVVDNEHQELVRIINLIIEHQSDHTSPQEIENILEQLVQYAVVHFQHEEALMESSGCDPHFVTIHKKVHLEFAQQVTKMREVPASGKEMELLLRFLSGWLTHHILGIDQAMGRQIRQIRAGISPMDAFAEEQKSFHDPATASMLEAMNALFRLIALRNDALENLNSSLEAQVAARTQALTEANGQLLSEQEQLQKAMLQIEITQKKLLASEHQRAEANKRNMQQLLAQIIDGDPVPTFVIDAEHRVTHWNRACASITKVAASDMVGSNNHWRAFYPESRPVMADLIVDGSLDGQIETYYQNHFSRSRMIEGAYEAEGFFPGLGEHGSWLFFTAAPLFDAAGKRIGAIETLQDITDRHRAEDDLRQYQNQLEDMVAKRTSQLAEANVALEEDRRELEQLLSKVDEVQHQLLQSEKLAGIGQLAAGVAHEINNPVGFVNSNLGTLKSYVEHLLGVIAAYESGDQAKIASARNDADLEFLREDLPALLADSREGLSRVTKIVQDLKDFSHVDHSEMQLANLNSSMESTINVASNELKYKAEVIRELGSIPEIKCIPAQINQVFMNMLVNAAQSIEGTGRITVRSGSTADELWFEIEDTGKGMTEEVKNHIFEPFFTTKPVGKGTGLGLSISYDIIVKKHNGTIDVRSQPGVGTCFRITLPVRQSNKVTAAT